jgi:hypothetical protein
MKPLLVLVILALAGCDAAPRPTAPASRYAIVSDSQGGVWQLDTISGEMRHCMLGADLEVHCWFAPHDNTLRTDAQGDVAK